MYSCIYSVMTRVNNIEMCSGYWHLHLYIFTRICIGEQACKHISYTYDICIHITWRVTVRHSKGIFSTNCKATLSTWKNMFGDSCVHQWFAPPEKNEFLTVHIDGRPLYLCIRGQYKISRDCWVANISMDTLRVLHRSKTLLVCSAAKRITTFKSYPGARSHQVELQQMIFEHHIPFAISNPREGAWFLPRGITSPRRFSEGMHIKGKESLRRSIRVLHCIIGSA